VGATLAWELDDLKLTANPEAGSSLTINWTAVEPNAGQTANVDLSYSASKTGENATPIASVPATAGSYVWDTSALPRGATSYVVARIGDGLNAVQRVSSAPFTTVAAPAGCSPRPNISVRSEPSGDGRLKVTITGSGQANPLQLIRFSPGNGALVDIPSGQTGATGSFTQALPSGTTTYSFFLRCAVAGQPATVAFTVVDGCGDWPSLAGGGTAAPF
jgi:hypothetical protein